MNFWHVLIIIFVLCAVFGSPQFGAWHPGLHHEYGYYPSSGFGGIVVILLVLWLLGII